MGQVGGQRNRSSVCRNKKRTADGWGSSTGLLSETALTGNDRLVSWQQFWNSEMAILYMNGTSSPYDIRFSLITSNSNPAIGEFQADATVYANEYFFLNATIGDIDGVADFVNATIEINGTIVLKWVNSTNTFSEHSDSNNYCTLDVANSVKAYFDMKNYYVGKRKLNSVRFSDGPITVRV